MLLVEEIFEDMTNCLSQYQKISLPSRELIEMTRRKLADSKTFEPQVQSDIVKHTGADQISGGTESESYNGFLYVWEKRFHGGKDANIK